MFRRLAVLVQAAGEALPATVRQASTRADKKQPGRSWRWRTRFLLGAAGTGALYFTYKALTAPYVPPPLQPGQQRQRVVVLGTGWGAVSMMKQLDDSRFEVICVSPRNFFLMTPLLPAVAVGTVEGRTVVESIRTLFGDRMSYVEAECISVDPERKVITCRSSGPALDEPLEHTQVFDRQSADDLRGSSSMAVQDSARARPQCEIPYDKLVIAVGAENNTFNIRGVETHAHFLKELADARRIRAAVSDCFESAAIPGQHDLEKRRLLHFVIVGGGPTGVEFAAELSDMINQDLSRYFPDVRDHVRITLVEAMAISDYTVTHFQRSSIDVAANTFVKEVKSNEVVVQRKGQTETETWPCAMVVWATGIRPRPLIQQLRKAIGEEFQHNRRALVTDQHLQVLGAKDIFSIGDCATIDQPKLIEKLTELFVEADQDNNESLTEAEFESFVLKQSKRFPQLELYAKDVAKAFAEADSNEDKQLSLQEFSAMLAQADSKLRSLPATAQVASQQGTYLAGLLNQLDAAARAEDVDQIRPFSYTHFGSLAYVGDESAVADFTGTSMSIGGSISGRTTFWLWRSFYLSEMFTSRTRLLLAFDWLRSKLYGRDISRL